MAACTILSRGHGDPPWDAWVLFIFGLNAARLYDVDVEATRCTLGDDAFAVARAERLQAKPLPVTQPHGPRTRREFLQLSALEQRVEAARRGSI